MNRHKVDLSGLGSFQPDPYWVGERGGFFLPEHDVRLWREVRVPCCFEACGPGMDAYEGPGWFRRELTVPAAWRGKRVVLRFEGICYHTTVWINGQHVGHHGDGFLPFEFDVGSVLNYGGHNLIAVATDNRRLQGEVPGEQRGWRSFGGFHREAELLATDLLRIDTVRADAAPDERGGILTLNIGVINDREDTVAAELDMVVVDASGATSAQSVRQLPLGSRESRQLSETIMVPNAPHLYDLRLALRQGAHVIDRREVRVGFRRIEVVIFRTIPVHRFSPNEGQRFSPKGDHWISPRSLPSAMPVSGPLWL